MSMEIKIFQLALERLMTEVELLKKQNLELRNDFDQLRQNNNINKTEIIKVSEPKIETELLDTKEVLKILGVCYNTLQAIIGKGGIKPIRINQRRIRYSKAQLIEYIEMKQNEG